MSLSYIVLVSRHDGMTSMRTVRNDKRPDGMTSMRTLRNVIKIKDRGGSFEGESRIPPSLNENRCRNSTKFYVKSLLGYL